MAKPKHTANELRQMQSLPLDIKIRMSCRRIKEWYDYWQGDVYVSFSGGKDSTVLMDLVINRCGLKDVPIVFVDTGLEFPEVKEFTKQYANVVLRPEKNFKEVLTDIGYPVISKEVALTVEGANNYIEGRKKDENYSKYSYRYRRMNGIGEYSKDNKGGYSKTNRSGYSLEHYKWLLDADFKISPKCCDLTKKRPANKYEKESGRKPMLGTTAEESRQRQWAWFQTGCNGFDGTHPKSTPMAFWTEQDILEYIVENEIEICAVYGNIVKDNEGLYRVTGRQRTGCVYCPLGCHLESEPNRFQQLKETHPKLYDYCINGGKYGENGKWQPSIDGLGLGHVLDFIGVKY